MGDSTEEVAIRNEYAAHPEGADGYYREFGRQYRNPHEDGVRAMLGRVPTMYPDLDFTKATVLDLACGSGEATIGLLSLKLGLTPDRITACDPYTAETFAERTRGHIETKPGLIAEPWSFADIALGALATRRFDLIVCAYALHLCEASWLPRVCLELAEVSPRLLVITPHKRPEIQDRWGWVLRQEDRDPAYRIRVRAYESATG